MLDSDRSNLNQKNAYVLFSFPRQASARHDPLVRAGNATRPCSNVSSFVGTIAVTLTVVYLAIQVRRSTKATYSQTYQFATQALGEMAAIVGENKDKSRIFAVGMADPNKLDEDEYYQFAYLGISLFRRYENVFFQYQSGMIDEDFWLGHRDNLLWFYYRPGTQVWWNERRLGFSRKFREFLESTSASDVSGQDVRKV